MGGLGKHAVILANRFIELGHSVDFLCNADAASEENVLAMGFKGRLISKPHLRIHWYVRKIENRAGVYLGAFHLAKAKRIARMITSIASNYDAIHYHGHFPLIARYLPETINLTITHHDYSLICIHKTLMKNGGNPCRIESRVAQCSQCHGRFSYPLLRWITLDGVKKWRGNARLAIERHKHIFVSRRLADVNLAVLGSVGHNISVIHNFIDCRRLREIMDACDSEPRKGNKITRVFLANSIDPHKGIGVFLDVCRQYRIFDGPIQITVAGSGRDLESLKVRFRDAPVRFLGFVPYEECIRQHIVSDVFVLSSICEESCSTGVLEALFLSKDVRALRLGGTPEFDCYVESSKQLKLFDTLDEMALSFKTEPVFRSSHRLNSCFGSCVEDSAHKLMDVYLQ